jgi:hypothetical protein
LTPTSVLRGTTDLTDPADAARLEREYAEERQAEQDDAEVKHMSERRI